MRKLLFLTTIYFVFLVSCITFASINKNNEDGAIYYNKAFKQLEPHIINASFRKSLFRIRKNGDIEKLSSKNKKILESFYNKKFLNLIFKAQKCLNCDLSSSIKESRYYLLPLLLKNLGWLAISKNKEKLGVSLFFANLRLSMKITNSTGSSIELPFISRQLKMLNEYLDQGCDVKLSKKIVTHIAKYSKSLVMPTPIALLESYKTIITNMLKDIDADDKKLLEYFHIKDPSRTKCKANMRIIPGGIEMCMMDDAIEHGSNAKFSEIMDLLHKEKYLRERNDPYTCPSNGTYSIHWLENATLELQCSIHGKVDDKIDKAKDPLYLKALEEYLKSGKYDRDKDGLKKYCEAIISVINNEGSNKNDEELMKILTKFNEQFLKENKANKLLNFHQYYLDSFIRLKKSINEQFDKITNCSAKAKNEYSGNPFIEKEFWKTATSRIVKKLFKEGFTINQTNCGMGGHPAIKLIAEYCKDPLVFDFLSGKGIKFDNSDDMTIKLAIKGNDPKIVDKLIKLGVSVSEPPFEASFLTYAIKLRCNQEIIRILVLHGANVNMPDKNGNTPILLLSKEYESEADPETIKTIVNGGGDINARTSDGDNCIMFGYRKRLDMLETMVKLGANINAVNKNGETYLYQAVGQRFSLKYIEALLKLGARINPKSNGSDNALRLANEPDLKEVFDLLTKYVKAGHK